MHDPLPYEHATISAMVTTSNADGPVSQGFGDLKVRALEGRAFAIEITEDLSGLTITAVLDFGRPKRARVDLQADELRDAVTAASKDQGMPNPFPVPK